MRGQLIEWTGTLDNPVMVRSAGEEQFAGCTGVPADSHNVIWLMVGIPRSATRSSIGRVSGEGHPLT
jgi:hypothetical protein